METSHRTVGVRTLDASGTAAAVEAYVHRVEQETQVFLDRLAAAGHDLALETEVFIAQAAAHRRLTRRFLEGQRLLLRAAVTGAVTRAESGLFCEPEPIGFAGSAGLDLDGDLAVGRWDQAEADLQHLLDRWWATERSASAPTPAVTFVADCVHADDWDTAPLTVDELLENATTDDLCTLCARLLDLLLPTPQEPLQSAVPAGSAPSEPPVRDSGDDPFMRFWAASQPPTPRPRRWLALPAVLTGFSVTMALSIVLAWVG